MIKKHLKRDAFLLPLTEHMCYNYFVDKSIWKRSCDSEISRRRSRVFPGLPHNVIAQVIATIRLDDVILFIDITALEIDLLRGKRGIQFDGITVFEDLLFSKVHQCFSQTLMLMIGKHEETVDVVFGDGDGSDGGAIDEKEIDEAVFYI